MKRKFRSLEFAAKTLINNFCSGSHGSILKDSIVDIDSIREYQPGDRKLDSKASLRTGQVMSRVFLPEKSLTIFILLDVSNSQFSKFEQTITTCLYLLYLANVNSDKVSLIAFADDIVKAVEPTDDTRDAVLALEDIYESELAGGTNLCKMLLKLNSFDLSNSMVFLLSDFCYDINKHDLLLMKRIASTSNGKFVALVMDNSSEWVFDKGFSFDFVDAENNMGANWNTNNKNLNKTHQNFYHEWKHDLKVKLKQARLEPLFINVNNNNYLMPLIRYLLQGNRS